MRFLSRWLLLSLSVFALPYVLPGIRVDGFVTAIIVAGFLGIINAFLRPLLLLLTLPIRILTFGLFSFIINAALLWFISSLIPGFTIANFWSALLGSIILAIVGTWINSATRRNR